MDLARESETHSPTVLEWILESLRPQAIDDPDTLSALKIRVMSRYVLWCHWCVLHYAYIVQETVTFQLLDYCSTEFTSDGSIFPSIFEGEEGTHSLLQFKCCVFRYDYSSGKDDPCGLPNFISTLLLVFDHQQCIQSNQLWQHRECPGHWVCWSYPQGNCLKIAMKI